MSKEITTIISEASPDLLEPPHVVPVLMELFAGDTQQAFAQQKDVFAHLVACHYCRTAAMFLLGVAEEYEHRNNDPVDVVHDLLTRFADIDRKIGMKEAQKYERLAFYAETIVAKSRDEAAELFPDLAAHLSVCSDCRSMVEETVAFLIEAEDTG